MLTAENRNSFEPTICGLLLRDEEDAKVIRWSLNSLAQFGRRENSAEFVKVAIKKYEEQPEIVAAGIAALSKMHQGHLDALEEINFIDPKIRTLAALQNTSPDKLDLRNFIVNIEKDDIDILKLALITVGLNRDIENLFHPRCDNGTIVKILGEHDDNIIVQYSVWAAIENDHLGIANLGTPLSKLDVAPPNVQSKVLQLVAEKDEDESRRHSLIAEGAQYKGVEAREGLAKGVMGIYYPRLEDVTIPWFDQEVNSTVQGLLAGHFSAKAQHCRSYEEKAITIFDSSYGLRSQLFVGSEGTPMYSKLKLREIQEHEGGLFNDGFEDDFVRIISDLSLSSKEKSTRKIKSLIFLISPPDQEKLRIDAELRDIQEKIAEVKNPKAEVEIDYRIAARIDQIQSAILNFRPQILQISGHGGEGSIVFEDKSGQTKLVSGDALSELVRLSSTIQCVILNACYSKEIAQLMKDHVDCVIGCDGAVSDQAAVAFGQGFYRALAHGQGYEKAFKWGRNEVNINCDRDDADVFVFI